MNLEGVYFIPEMNIFGENIVNDNFMNYTCGSVWKSQSCGYGYERFCFYWYQEPETYFLRVK